jgi:hypothetical protein
MHKVAGLLTLIFVLLQSGGTVLAETCEYAGQTFGPGATICECPNLRVVRGAGGRGEITSRRLACSKDQTWVNTYSGFVNGQNPSVLSGTITYGGSSQGAVNVGTYTIIPSGQTSSNYARQWHADDQSGANHGWQSRQPCDHCEYRWDDFAQFAPRFSQLLHSRSPATLRSSVARRFCPTVTTRGRFL